MRVVVDENIPLVKEAFSHFGEVLTLPGRAITNRKLLDAEILLVRSVTEVNESLLHDSPVKFVASATIGVDHIDQEYLKKNRIGFAYAPGSNADSVAEYILAALMTTLSRTEMNIENITLGIIGVGNIGSRVFRHARTLGLETLICDPPKQRLTQCSMYCSLDEVLAASDIVTLHVPLTTNGSDRTEQLVDESFIRKMKKGAVLINTSRGRIVDEQAVLHYRDSLGGLVLDVWNNEPAISAELVAAANIATPHIAGYSYDGKIRGTKAIYDAACAYFFNEPKWSPLYDVVEDRPGTIHISVGSDSIYSAIIDAYPIERDHKQLTKIMVMNAADRPAYFDSLRKTYPRRYEFNHFTVDPKFCSYDQKQKLKLLGFKVL